MIGILIIGIVGAIVLIIASYKQSVRESIKFKRELETILDSVTAIDETVNEITNLLDEPQDNKGI